MVISHRDVFRVRDAMARRFALDGSSIYMGFLPVVGSSVDFISFRAIAVLPARPHLYIASFHSTIAE